MLKSISRQILEVTHTDHPYFERAFFVVRHDCIDRSSDELAGDAQQVLNRQPVYSGIRRSRLRQQIWQGLLFLAGAILGAAGALLITHAI